MRKILKRFDRSLYKYNPDQVIVRLNEIVDSINSMSSNQEVKNNTINSNEVIIIGNQPDGSFGIVKWERAGDRYINPTVVI